MATRTSSHRGAVGGVRLADPVRLLAVLGLVFAILGVAGLATGGISMIRSNEAIDLDINLVAARHLVEHRGIYDADTSRRDAIDLGGQAMDGAYTRPLNGNPSPPSTALLHVPFLAFGHGTAVALFRWLAAAGMLAAVALVARTVPAGSRLAAGWLGGGVLIGSIAFARTLQLGQGHEFVMLGLAVGIWGSARDRWTLAGAGLGLATVLKVTPGLLVLYLLLRGKRDAAKGAAGTAAALLGAAAIVGRPTELLVWLRDIVPGANQGTVRVINQSLPALLSRLTSGIDDLGADGQLGNWRHVALALALGSVLLLWRARRHRPFDPLELGVLVLVVLVSGPLTWEHYATWAALPVVLIVDPRRWEHRSGAEIAAVIASIATAGALLTLINDAPRPADLAAQPLLRLTSSPTIVAILLLLAASVRLLTWSSPPPRRPEDGSDVSESKRAGAGAAMIRRCHVPPSSPVQPRGSAGPPASAWRPKATG